MSSPKLLHASVTRHFKELNDNISIVGNNNIKEALALARKNHKENKETPAKLDLEIMAEPFFVAFNTNFTKFAPITVSFLSTLFHASTAELFPNKRVTERSVKVLTYIHRLQDDTIKLKACKFGIFIILSPSGSFFVHDKLFADLIRSMLSMYQSLSEDSNCAEIIEKSLQEMMRIVVGCYDTLIPMEEFDTVDELAAHTTKCITMHCIEAIDLMPSYPEYANAHDLDVTVAIRALTQSLEKRMYSKRAIVLALSTLNGIMNTDLAFFSKPFFKDILNTDIRVAILAATFDTSFETVPYTSGLIATVWDKFPHLFAEGLNEVLDSGLTIALSSPDPHTVRRACHVYRLLTAVPQLFIDAFVNFDCDHSGYFKNIFENSSALVIKNCYPSETAKNVQKTALSTVTELLENLWKYCSNPPQTEVPESLAQDFIAQKDQKTKFDTGVDLFRTNPKKGIKYFVSQGIVEDTPEAIGNFLFDTPQLDPASVGEIIGSGNQAEVRSQFVSRFDFRYMKFETAFRTFLKKFVICGEGQMIDRVMEEFGNKYYSENPDFFSCADTVYVLAYSTLMLHTDAHHPTIKKHMTLQEFIKNNNGIDNGRNLPEDFLRELYQGITKEKIFHVGNAVQNASLLSREQKAELYQQQCENTLIEAREHITEANRKFTHCESPLLLGPMMKSIWGRLVAALAISLEESNSEEITQLCLRSMEAAFHISSHCYVEEATQSLLDAFTKFTGMRFADDVLKKKNLDCTHAFLRCVIEDKSYVKTAWSIFFDAISDMERIKTKEIVCKAFREAEGIFNESTTLDRESLVDFTRAMCEVSSREIEEGVPRYYMLNKICDVALDNMDREKIVWNDIWYSIGPHLTLCGTHMNEKTALLAVDLLHKLSLKFLSKKEMSAFHFQQRFLQPFFDIFMGTQLGNVRIAVLDKVTDVVEKQHSNLISAWPVILKLLSEAARTHCREKAFEKLEMVLVNFQDDLLPFIKNVMEALSAFALSNDDSELAFRTLPFFTVFSALIKDQETWETVFEELIRVSSHPAAEIKTLSLESLLEIVLKYGCAMNQYSEKTWEMVLSKEFPEMLKAATDDFKETLLGEMYNQVFSFQETVKVSMVLMFTVSSVNAFSGKSFADTIADSFIKFADGKDVSEEKETISKLVEGQESPLIAKIVSSLGLN